MTFVVPFDGSDLAEAALVRATELSVVLDEQVVAVSVIPNGNSTYARERDWIGSEEEFDLQSVVASLHTQVTELCPTANFKHEVVDPYTSSGTISSRLRSVARDEDASMVFIGSENAGHLVTAVSSVGATVAADESYDVVIVRNRSPARIEEIRNASPHQKSKSDFYVP